MAICQTEEAKNNGRGLPCAYNIVLGLLKGVSILEHKFGPNMNKWKFGNIHSKYYEHVPFT